MEWLHAGLMIFTIASLAVTAQHGKIYVYRSQKEGRYFIRAIKHDLLLLLSHRWK